MIPGRVSHVALYDYKPELDGTANYAMGSAVAKIITAAPTAQPARRSRRWAATWGGTAWSAWAAEVAVVATKSAVGRPWVHWKVTGLRQGPGLLSCGVIPQTTVQPAREELLGRAHPRRGRKWPRDLLPQRKRKLNPRSWRTDFIVLFIWKEQTPSDDRRPPK